MKKDLKKPDIQRLLTTIKGGIPDRVPHLEALIEARSVKHFLGKDLGSTMESSRGAYGDSFICPPMEPEYYMELCRLTGQDAMNLDAEWAPLKYRDDKGDLHIVQDGRLKTWEALDNCVKPTWEMDIEPRRRIIREYVKAAKGSGIGVTITIGAFFMCSYFFLCEFNEFLTKIYSDREFVEKLMDICVDYYVQMAEVAVEEGIDFLFLSDDIAYKQGTFVEPELFKELWLPRAMKIMQPAKDAGLPIMYHSCGNITNIMDSIIMQMGVDGLNPIEPYSMDIFDIKKKYGDKLTLMGNIDIAGPLACGTPDEVREDVKNHLEKLMPGGRYIISTNHSIIDDIIPENYEAMIETFLEYGVY